MISLLKFLDGPWETVRGYLREDLDHLEAAINQRWNATFGDSNTLLPSVVPGNTSTPLYVANTGAGQTLKFDLVDLGAGVKSRLAFSHLVAATAASRLAGRGSAAGAGDFQEISLATSLSMTGTTLGVVSTIVAHPLLDGVVDSDTTAGAPVNGDVIAATGGHSVVGAITITDVQSVQANNLQDVAITAFASNPVAGDSIVVAVVNFTNVHPAVAPTDSAGNTYVQLGTTQNNSGNNYISIWHAANIIGGSSFVVTTHFSGGVAQFSLQVAWCLHGVNTNPYNGDFVSATGNSTAPASGASGVTPAASSMYLGFTVQDGTHAQFTVGSGWNATGVNGFTAAMANNAGRCWIDYVSNVDHLESEYKISSTPISATWTSPGSANWTAIAVSFAPIVTVVPPTWQRIPGNTVATQKFLSETGDGSVATAPSWQTIPATGSLVFFFFNTASDIATYLVMKTPASVGAAQVTTTAGIANGDTTLASFATLAGVPNVTFVPAGTVTGYITARQTAGGAKVVQLLGELFQRTSGGVETLLATTAVTIPLTGVDAAYIFQGAIPSSLVFVASDRLVMKIIARASGGGSAATVVWTIEGLTAARSESPSATVDATNFVPYTGATANVDLGSKNLTTTGTLTLPSNPLAVTSGGTGVTTSTGSGSNVLSASPTLTGVPLAPTAAPGTNTTQLATTAFVTAAITQEQVVTSTITTTGTQTALAIPSGQGDLVIFANNATLLTVQGITAGTDGQKLTIHSIGAGQVDFVHQSGSATAANRLINFATTANTSLGAGSGEATFIYDLTSARWRLDEFEQGAWITPAFSAGNFTASGTMTWTVIAGNVNAYNFRLSGRTLSINWNIQSTTVVAPLSTELRMVLPGGYTGARATINTYVYNDNGTGFNVGETFVPNAPGTYVAMYTAGFGTSNWSASTTNTQVTGSLTLEVK